MCIGYGQLHILLFQLGIGYCQTALGSVTEIGIDREERCDNNYRSHKRQDTHFRQVLLLLQYLFLFLTDRLLLIRVYPLRLDDSRIQSLTNLIGYNTSRIGLSRHQINCVLLQQELLDIIQRIARLHMHKNVIKITQQFGSSLPFSRHCQIVAGIQMAFVGICKVRLLESLKGIFCFANLTHAFKSDGFEDVAAGLLLIDICRIMRE